MSTKEQLERTIENYKAEADRYRVMLEEYDAADIFIVKTKEYESLVEDRHKLIKSEELVQHMNGLLDKKDALLSKSIEGTLKLIDKIR